MVSLHHPKTLSHWFWDKMVVTISDQFLANFIYFFLLTGTAYRWYEWLLLSCSPALLSGCFLAGGCITKCSHEYHCKNILKETFVYLLSHSDWRRVMLLLLWNPINNGDRPDRYKLATRLTLRFMMNWYGEIFVLRASLCGKYWEVV